MTRSTIDLSAPDDAPLDLTLLRQHDQGISLMDRAQRRLATSDAIFARAHALRERAATSALPQEAQLAALDRQSGQLADAERTQSGYRRLRERYDPAELERSLQAIAAIPIPCSSARASRSSRPAVGREGAGEQHPAASGCDEVPGPRRSAPVILRVYFVVAAGTGTLSQLISFSSSMAPFFSIHTLI